MKKTILSLICMLLTLTSLPVFAEDEILEQTETSETDISQKESADIQDFGETELFLEDNIQTDINTLQDEQDKNDKPEGSSSAGKLDTSLIEDKVHFDEQWGLYVWADKSLYSESLGCTINGNGSYINAGDEISIKDDKTHIMLGFVDGLKEGDEFTLVFDDGESKTLVAPDTTLYNIKLDYQGGKCDDEEHYENSCKWQVGVDSHIVPTSAFGAIREGYDFAGWYGEPECINKIVNFTYDIVTKYNSTLYAKWEKKTEEGVVYVDGNLKESIEKAQSGDRVVLTKDEEYQGSMDINNKNIIIDLAGHKINGGDLGMVAGQFWSLNINNSNVEIVNTEDAAEVGIGSIYLSQGSLTIGNGVTLKTNSPIKVMENGRDKSLILEEGAKINAISEEEPAIVVRNKAKANVEITLNGGIAVHDNPALDGVGDIVLNVGDSAYYFDGGHGQVFGLSLGRPWILDSTESSVTDEYTINASPEILAELELMLHTGTYNINPENYLQDTYFSEYYEYKEADGLFIVTPKTPNKEELDVSFDKEGLIITGTKAKDIKAVAFRRKPDGNDDNRVYENNFGYIESDDFTMIDKTIVVAKEKLGEQYIFAGEYEVSLYDNSNRKYTYTIMSKEDYFTKKKLNEKDVSVVYSKKYLKVKLENSEISGAGYVQYYINDVRTSGSGSSTFKEDENYFIDDMLSYSVNNEILEKGNEVKIRFIITGYEPIEYSINLDDEINLAKKTSFVAHVDRKGVATISFKDKESLENAIVVSVHDKYISDENEGKWDWTFANQIFVNEGMKDYEKLTMTVDLNILNNALNDVKKALEDGVIEISLCLDPGVYTSKSTVFLPIEGNINELRNMFGNLEKYDNYKVSQELSDSIKENGIFQSGIIIQPVTYSNVEIVKKAQENGITIISNNEITATVNNIKVSELPEKVQITLTPANFKEPSINSNQAIKYYVIHNHNDNVEVIDEVEYDKDKGSFIFSALNFSAYSIGYKIVTNSNSGSSSSSGSSTSSGSTVVKKPVVNTSVR